MSSVRKVEIHIETENSAFAEDMEGEVSRIVQEAAMLLGDNVVHQAGRSFKDVNGNTVAYIEIF